MKGSKGRCRSPLLLLVALLPAAGCAAPENTEEAGATPAVLAQYVIMGFSAIEQAPAALARAVVEGAGAACPPVVFSDSRAPLPMQPRLNPDPAAFGVTVCEAAVAVDDGISARVQGSATPLPLPPSSGVWGDKIAIIADSGCKDDAQQPCTEDAWRFPRIAAAAAAAAPDLVLHLGDYNYRGTPSKTASDEWSYDGCVPEGRQPIVDQRTRDNWDTWQADFFEPARPLLDTAPWVVVRGNHELCSRAGQGWFYFLDAHSTLLDPDVAAPSCNAPIVQTDPYTLSLQNLDLVVLDSANACGGEEPQSAAATEENVASFARQFDAVNQFVAAGSRPAWLLSHRPIWGIARYGTGPPDVITDTLQKALATSLVEKLADAFSIVMSGHMHEFESITFSGGRQPQLIVGDSGVELTTDELAPGFENTMIDGIAANGIVNDTVNGYLLAEVQDGAHWSATLFGFTAGQDAAIPMVRCGLPAAGAVCTTVPGGR